MYYGASPASMNASTPVAADARTTDIRPREFARVEYGDLSMRTAARGGHAGQPS